MQLPKTPEFLLRIGSNLEAKQAYIWFHGCDQGFEKLEILIKEATVTSEGSQMPFIHLMKEPLARKPFLISLGLFGFQQLCGLTFLYVYMEEIFINAHANIDPGTSAAIVGLLQAFLTLMSALTVEKFGRRCLLLVSYLGVAISYLPLAFFFNIKERGVMCHYITTGIWLCELVSVTIPRLTCQLMCMLPFAYCIQDCPSLMDNINWLPLVTLVAIISFFSIGAGPLTWTMNAELFPQEVTRMGKRRRMSISRKRRRNILKKSWS